MKINISLFLLCTSAAVAVAHAKEEDCETMDMCNLTDAVPGINGPKFTEMQQEQKVDVCRSLKTALDCSSIYSCDRLTRLVNGGERFFNVFCTKIFHQMGLSLDNCVRDAHSRAVDKCQSHLEKMKALANHVSPNEEAVRQACCEHRTYADCYRQEVGSKCSLNILAVPLHPDRKVDTFCSVYKNSPSLCREQRQLNSFDVPASISAAATARDTHHSALCGATMVLLVLAATWRLMAIRC